MSAKVKTHDQRKKAHRPKGPWLNRVFIGMLTFCFGLLTFIFEGFVLRDIETIRQPDWETYRSQRSDQSLNELQVRSSELGRQLVDLDRQRREPARSNPSLRRSRISAPDGPRISRDRPRRRTCYFCL